MSILIVGAGFAGATYARTLAEAGYDVHVIDSRDHIGGNAYDYVHETGVRVHRYGPHLFHTNNEDVVRWLERFGEFVPYEHSVTVAHVDRYLPMPIGRGTVEAYYDRRFETEAELEAFLASVAVPSDNPRNAAEYLNSRIGPDLTDLLFRRYTKKMWNLDLEDMDAAVVKRISINTGYEHRYFPNDKFQLMPKDGYTRIFESIFDHPLIRIALETAFDPSMVKDYDHVFTSAAIDEHYEYQFGQLPYRSLRFHSAVYPATESDPPTSVVNFSDTGPFTRETYWHMLPQHRVTDTGSYLKTKEEPCDFRDNNLERYYPVKDAAGQSQARYQTYKELADKEEKLTFIGRCGTYQYLDMHQVINQSLQGATRWLRERGEDVRAAG